MKKLLALLLACLMVIGCFAAVAEESATPSMQEEDLHGVEDIPFEEMPEEEKEYYIEHIINMGQTVETFMTGIVVIIVYEVEPGVDLSTLDLHITIPDWIIEDLNRMGDVVSSGAAPITYFDENEYVAACIRSHFSGVDPMTLEVNEAHPVYAILNGHAPVNVGKRATFDTPYVQEGNSLFVVGLKNAEHDYDWWTFSTEATYIGELLEVFPADLVERLDRDMGILFVFNVPMAQ